VPGIRRRRRGRGFEYLDEQTGERVEDEETLERVAALAVPPAWTDVWICADPFGHLQAVGTDTAGRRQYRYHDCWLERRAQEKFDEMLRFARALPEVRAVTARHLRRKGLKRERVLAGAVRLLDLGFFRIGSESYAEENGTYGLATMRRRHVRLEQSGVLVFDYRAKGRKRHVQAVADRAVYGLVHELMERRGGGEELLAYRNGDGWRDVRSTEINEYVKELAGEGFSAKDFRTWSGTVLAAVALARAEPPGSERARKRAVSAAVTEVAEFLGNTPAVARSAYIDPRVIDRFREGVTIAAALNGKPPGPELDLRGPIEEAVLDLLT
jgi:DNA topoisomerase IB